MLRVRFDLSQEHPMNTIQLLVADDEALECDALELLISQTGYKVTCLKAKNGREAVNLARLYRPQIIILDIQMPGMNGLESAENIRSFLPESIIVFLTAWGRFDFAQKAIRVGASDYLVKPVDKDKIKHLLDTCFLKLNNPTAKGKDIGKADIYDNIELQQVMTKLQNAVLDGNLEQAVGTEQELLDSIYSLYGHTENAGHQLYEFLLVFCYGVCKSVPFLYQEKPSSENPAELETVLAEFIRKACDAVREDRQDKYQRIFVLATEYIGKHYMEQISTESISRKFDMHPVYFTQLFHKYCKKTFIEYLTDIRMKNAADQIAAGKSVRDTAAASGFSDTNYFSRVFRKYYGVSPADYTGEIR
jgi:two-component system, response regulator YesN